MIGNYAFVDQAALRNTLALLHRFGHFFEGGLHIKVDIYPVDQQFMILFVHKNRLLL